MLAILRLKVFSLFLCLRSFDARVYDASPRRRRDPGLHLFELFAPIRRRPHETYAIYVTSEALAEEEAGEARRRAWNSDRADRASECIARVHRAMHASARSRVNWFRALERAIGQQIPSSASPIAAEAARTPHERQIFHKRYKRLARIVADRAFS